MIFVISGIFKFCYVMFFLIASCSAAIGLMLRRSVQGSVRLSAKNRNADDTDMTDLNGFFYPQPSVLSAISAFPFNYQFLSFNEINRKFSKSG